MTANRKFLALSSVAVLLAGACATQTAQGTSGGEIAIDSLSATRTAILRIQNNYPTEVRVYTVTDGKSNYLTKAMPGETRTWVMDPNLFPAQSISFETRPVDGTAPQVVGPYKVNKGETVELVVPATLQGTRATVHKSTP
jgi:hypothetical protein